MWILRFTDVAWLLWQVLLLPGLVTAWDRGIYRPPSCLRTISVSIVFWTGMGYKQSKQTEGLERFGFGEWLSNSHQLCRTEHRGICGFWQRLVFFRGIYHIVEVMALHRWATTSPNITLLLEDSPTWLSLSPLPWGPFPSWEETLHLCTSGDNKKYCYLKSTSPLTFLVHVLVLK